MSCLVARPTDVGYTYTLTTYAIKYLMEAEDLYGERTNDFIFGGVELAEKAPPRVWYPYNKFVVIQVTQQCASDVVRGIFQISHEVIHVISPNGQPQTNNLEEGLATYFSKLVTDRDTVYKNFAKESIVSSKYFYPFELVTKLLSVAPDAIKRLRKVQPVIGKINITDFETAGLNIADELVSELVKPMIY